MQLIKLAASLVAAASAASAFEITKPGPDSWWVAKSTNLLEWDCSAPDNQAEYTVQIRNLDIPTLVLPQPIIAQIKNFDCSITISVSQADHVPGTGYQILLANIFNGTDVLATSEPFEIKPLGSAYPPQGKPASSSGAAGAKPSGEASSDDEEKGAALPISSSTYGIVAAVGTLFAALF